jgi:hypothetical protein
MVAGGTGEGARNAERGAGKVNQPSSADADIDRNEVTNVLMMCCCEESWRPAT